MCCGPSASPSSPPTCRPRTRTSTWAATQIWDKATEALRQALDRNGLPYEIKEGDAAFYGPKIDIDVRDAIGRTWQLSTIQCDFNHPERFGLEYVGADNARHRPIMLHRALFGSIERFFAILIEHYAGALPTWLAPEQVRVLGVRDDHQGYADEVAAELSLPGRAGRGRPGRRAARRPHPPGQAAQDPLHPGGGRRRRRRRHRRGQPAGERPPRPWSPDVASSRRCLLDEIADRVVPEASDDADGGYGQR